MGKGHRLKNFSNSSSWPVQCIHGVHDDSCDALAGRAGTPGAHRARQRSAFRSVNMVNHPEDLNPSHPLDRGQVLMTKVSAGWNRPVVHLV